MNEFELIARLTQSLPTNANVLVGAGDDCAVLDLGLPDRLLLFKTDAVVEGVHFAKDTPPEKIGHKALARSLSDIAAMAGKATAALVTLGLPKPFEPEYIGKIYDGRVTSVKDFGAFVEIIPGKDGLVHISQLAANRVNKVTDVVKEGDKVKVKLLGVDERGKVRLSMKAVDQATGEDLEAKQKAERGDQPQAAQGGAAE